MKTETELIAQLEKLELKRPESDTPRYHWRQEFRSAHLNLLASFPTPERICDFVAEFGEIVRLEFPAPEPLKTFRMKFYNLRRREGRMRTRTGGEKPWPSETVTTRTKGNVLFFLPQTQSDKMTTESSKLSVVSEEEVWRELGSENQETER